MNFKKMLNLPVTDAVERERAFNNYRAVRLYKNYG